MNSTILVTSEHQHHWLLIGRALQDWRAKAKQPSKLEDNTALWGMLTQLCDPLEKTCDHLFAGMMCSRGTSCPSIALQIACLLIALLAAVDYCTSFGVVNP